VYLYNSSKYSPINANHQFISNQQHALHHKTIEKETVWKHSTINKFGNVPVGLHVHYIKLSIGQIKNKDAICFSTIPNAKNSYFKDLHKPTVL
jgi:hypothetical protein